MKHVFYIILILLFAGNQLSAKVYNVASNNELKNTISSLLPGDTILLSPTTWKDQDIDFIGNGTAEKPIVFGAKIPGQTFLTGSSRIDISGTYVEVRDLILKDGNFSSSGNIIEFRTSSSNLANHCRLTNVSINNYNPVSKSTDTKYVSMYGTHNRVDHCSFEGKNNSGATFVVWLDDTPDYHIIDNNYFGKREDLGVNGGETIRIGTSEWERYNSNCIVEYNLFEECDGEIEIISNKSVGNHYRYNTFNNCEGTLTLRHGSDCQVYGNFFFGNLNKNCGGIRVIGPGHFVYNNYLENLNGTSYRAAICLMNGVPNSPANRYRQVENAMVGYNTIINCKEPFAIGAGKDSEKTLAPSNCNIENNLIVTRAEYDLVKDYDSTDGVSWKGIFNDAQKIGITASGFIHAELPMDNSGRMSRPTASNPAVNNAVAGVFDTLKVDIDGQLRSSSANDAGCDQLSDSAISNHPLTADDVGAKFEAVNHSNNELENTLNVTIREGNLKINFEKEMQRTISIYEITGRQIARWTNQSREFSWPVLDLPVLMIVNIIEKGNQFTVKIKQQ